VSIEFDSYYDPVLNDPLTDHIGINTKGSLISLVTATVANVTNNATMSFSASQWYAWIDFDIPSMNLQVRISTTSTKPAAAQIQSTVDFYSLLGQSTMYLGFGGATGGGYQTSTVFAWEYILACILLFFYLFLSFLFPHTCFLNNRSTRDQLQVPELIYDPDRHHYYA